MDGIKKDIDKARKAGYNDDEIVEFLSAMPEMGEQINTAIGANFSSKQILSFLAQQKSQAYEAGAKLPTPVRAAISTGQGPTLNLLPRLAGLAAAPVAATEYVLTGGLMGMPLGQAYERTRDIFRGAAESFEQQYPITSGVSQGVASLPLSMAALPTRVGQAVMPAIREVAPTVAPTLSRAGSYLTAAPARGQMMGMGQRVAQSGASGAGYGFISGLGSAYEEDPLEALKKAAVSSTIGGTLGAASQPVLGVLGAGGRQIASRVSPPSAATYAQQKVAEALIRDVPEALAPSALTRAQARLATLGPEARIADVGGKSTRNLLDVQATLPGTTTEAVERAIRERQSGRAARMMTAADEALGTGGAGFRDSLDAFNAQRFTQSRPYYAAIDRATVTVNDELLDVLNKTKGVQGPTELLYGTRTGLTLDLSKLKKGDQLPMNLLDDLKQTLFDTSSSLRTREGMGAQANAYDDVRTKLIAELERQSPKVGGKSAYSMAMQTWAGPSQMRAAAEAGRKAMTQDIFDLGTVTRNLTPSEIDAFRIGALDALRQKTGTEAGQTSLLKMWKEPATQTRLKEIFGNDYRSFAAAVAREGRLKALESTGRGSQTAARLAGAADLDVAPLAQTVAAVSSGSPMGIITAATNLARQTQTPESVRNEIGRILLSRDPRQLDQLADVVRRVNEARVRSAGRSGVVSGQTGGLLSDYVAP
jgi:hypothetical protein